ncbi:MAG TPA: methyltransferase domain-containing protein [Propionicimonas sp.]
MVTFVESRGIEGASVLEIGGGVGYLCVELLRRGAATATNLDLSPNYEEDASDLVTRFGLAGRLARLKLDIAREPGAVPPADIVVLNRVVCCYPDYAGLLSAAGGHARSGLVMSYPTANPLTAFWLRMQNWTLVVRGREFRAYLHDPAAMVGVLERSGLRLVMEHHGPMWSIAGFERKAA